MNLLYIFGNNIRKYRKKLGLSQEKFAELCDLHRTYISDVERGERNVSIQNVQKIAHALKIDAYKLLMENDND